MSVAMDNTIHGCAVIAGGEETTVNDRRVASAERAARPSAHRYSDLAPFACTRSRLTVDRTAYHGPDVLIYVYEGNFPARSEGCGLPAHERPHDVVASKLSPEAHLVPTPTSATAA